MARLEFRSYRRQFKPPLQTHHGEWRFREGIILRLVDDAGKARFGEIAPLSWFGSESFEQALDFCHQLPGEITAETIFSIPSTLPACQFGFESAWEAMAEGSHPASGTPLPNLREGMGFDGSSELTELLSSAEGERARYDDDTSRLDIIVGSQPKIQNPKSKIPLSGLLPTGEAALGAWLALWHQGYRTFKWKIGVASMQAEIKTFNQLVQALPPAAKLRLDANGGLSYQEAIAWLRVCDPVDLEFLEQPLPIDQFDAMLELSSKYVTPLALDESIATLNQLQDCYQKGWRGIFVIKPAIAGSPAKLRQFCQTHEIDAVFSSVFETVIARQAGLQLAAELSCHNRAAGFGVNHWFNEDDGLDQLASPNFEHIWNSL